MYHRQAWDLELELFYGVILVRHFCHACGCIWMGSQERHSIWWWRERQTSLVIASIVWFLLYAVDGPRIRWTISPRWRFLGWHCSGIVGVWACVYPWLLWGFGRSEGSVPGFLDLAYMVGGSSAGSSLLLCSWSRADTFGSASSLWLLPWSQLEHQQGLVAIVDVVFGGYMPQVHIWECWHLPHLRFQFFYSLEEHSFLHLFSPYLSLEHW